jgi:tetratricopeptide (TPR) repeat protein
MNPAAPPPSTRPRLPPATRAALVLAVFASTLAAYHPALRGTLVWDDDAHLTAPALRSLAGLGRIWFRLGSTQQYYPVLHSAFWLEHRIWGDSVLGYHLLNVGLHALSACLFAGILSRLRPAWGPWIPWLAAALFALHPVCTESVAWISEEKNTLSLALYLLSAHAYLRFDEGRRGGWYAAALVLYALAVLSKSVTASLPAALLLAAYWRDGRVSLRRDVLPLVPWFAVGVPAGLLTAWVERAYIGAHGAAYGLGVAERLLLAGNVVWFYLGKLLWPSGLAFLYPHWRVEVTVPWAAGLAATLGAAAALWAFRRRSLGPWVAFLFFVGSLFPALGFFNVYPFRFSYVADHWQYLPCLGAAAAAAYLLGRAGRAASVAVLAVLLTLTWRQAGIYRDLPTLYRDTLAKNPDCWMAHSNLGVYLMDHGSETEAVAHLREAVRLNADYSDGHNNLGNALSRRSEGRAEAIREFERAITLEPGMWQAHANLGAALAATGGRLPEAVAQFREALRDAPEGAGARDLHARLAGALEGVPGGLDEAVREFRAALDGDAGNAEVMSRLGLALDREGKADEALRELEGAVTRDPASAEAQTSLGSVLAQAGRTSEALAHLREAVRLDPGSADAHFFLGRLLAGGGDREAALGQYREAVAIAPGSAPVRSSLGSLLYALGRFEEARAEYAEAARLDPASAPFRSNLGISLLRLGRSAEAAEAFRKALELDPGFKPARDGLDEALGRP